MSEYELYISEYKTERRAFMDKYVPMLDYMNSRLSPIADVIVMAFCMLLYVLMGQSYVVHNNMLRRIRFSVVSSYFMVLISITLYTFAIHFPQAHLLIYTLRLLYYIMASSNAIFFADYLQTPLRCGYTKRYKQVMHGVCYGLLGVTIAGDILFTILGIGFRISPDNMVHSIGGNFFQVFIILIYLGVIFNICRSRLRVTRRIRVGLYLATVASIFILFLQSFAMNNYYMSFAVIMPIFSLVFLFHTGAYDIETAMAGSDVFYNELDTALKNKERCFIFICRSKTLMKEIHDPGAYRQGYQMFYTSAVKDGIICQIDTHHIAMLFRKRHANVKFDDAVKVILQSFGKAFDGLKMDYRLMSMETTEKLTSASDYKALFRFEMNKVQDFSAHRITEQSVDDFLRSRYILEELNDIHMKRDLNDPRVLAYCQPVWNIDAKLYDTAEVLMRLKLDEYGMIFPDQFISLAEENGYIHTLTLIILNKTCKSIRQLLDDGYRISRISVNFSVQDFHEDTICKEVMDIIQGNDVPADKIAIEITESKIINNFEEIKPYILSFHELGMRLYLDDFGTGYSNFERIMELPFHIIKFDRSMTLETHKSESNRYMVKTFSEMFRSLRYDVLFEGVEDATDENNCIEMKASYLQGYKYSKPIPIEQLKNFMTRG